MSIQSISKVAAPSSAPGQSASLSSGRAKNLWQKAFNEILKKERREIVKDLKEYQKKYAHFGYLDWRDRPLEIQEQIKREFSVLKECNNLGHWHCQGAPEYEMMFIQETQLIRQMIEEIPPTQKEFVILDVGAGNFQWGENMMKFINSLTNIRQDLTFHIINIRGESYDGAECLPSGRCVLHNIGAFKVEELEKEFCKRGFSLSGKVDFAISRLCLVHLVDSVGTFAQIYNLLRPGHGLFLFDSLNYMRDSDTDRPEYAVNRKHCIQLLRDLKDPFLIYLSKMLVKRVSSSSCLLPMRYQHLNKEFSKASLLRKPQRHDNDEILPFRLAEVQGDYSLYQWLTKNFVKIINPMARLSWSPLCKAKNLVEKVRS